LPESVSGAEIRIPGGERAKYVFPQCHRVVWSEHRYRCNPDGSWSLVSGSATTDALCHGGPPNSQYVRTGEY
jgi:hypothetical protein